MAYLLSTPSRQKTTVASVDFVAKYSSGAVADFHRSSLTTEAMSISILKAKKILSSKRFASFGKDHAHGGTDKSKKLKKLKVMSKRSIARGRAMLKRLEKNDCELKISPWRNTT